jgi:rod shape-determining protein MreB
MVTIEVRGRDLIAGIPKTLTIDSEEIRLAILEQTDAIIEAVNTVLEHTPAELAADITEKGIVLTGGGALLTNMDRLLHSKINLPIKISEDPLSTVAMGAGKVIDSIEILKQVMVT